MVCGVGIGTQLAINGASAHAFAHILYKGLLFMGAGAVMHMTGVRKLNEMGGLYKTMPVTLGLLHDRRLRHFGGASVQRFRKQVHGGFRRR